MSLNVAIDLSEANPNAHLPLVQYLNIIFGPPGSGALAVSPGDPDGDNAPGQAVFYPNTDAGRQAYARMALAHSSERGGNNYLSSAIWATEMLERKRAPLTLDGAKPVVLLRFPVLWCDVDKDGYNAALLEELKVKGCLINTSGGKRDSGKARFHIRVLLDEPMTDVDEFYALNKWLAKALGGEKFAPVSWLTMPGTARFKDEYPGGMSEVKVIHQKVREQWSVKELRKLFKTHTPEPAVDGVTARTDGALTPTEVNLRRKDLFKVREILRQEDPGDGTARYKQTAKLVKTCAEAGLSKDQALWVLLQHDPSMSKFGEYRMPGQVHACWPETKVERSYEAPKRTGRHRADWLMQQDLPPLQWCIPGLIPEGLGMIVAPPKAGKSWLVLNLALACAAGGKALGKLSVDKRPVLYYALEDSHLRLQGRIRALMGGNSAPPMEYVLEIDEQDEDGPIQEMMEFAHENKGAMIIVDTLQKIKPAENDRGNSYAQDYAYMSLIKQVPNTVPGTTLLLVHHTRKQESDDFVNTVSGTQGIAGGMDFILALVRKRNAPEAQLHVTGRDLEGGEYGLAMPGGGSAGLHWTLTGDTLEDSQCVISSVILGQKTTDLSDRSQAVLDYVNSAPEPVRAGDLAADLGISANTATTYLNRMADAGRIEKLGRGTFGRG